MVVVVTVLCRFLFIALALKLGDVGTESMEDVRRVPL